MNCSMHTDRDAQGECARCGQGFCVDCLVMFDGKYYCKTHVQTVMDERRRLEQLASGVARDGKGQPKYSYITGSAGAAGKSSERSRGIAFLLCLFGGIGGLHRFYVGKIGTGLLYLCTGGLAFVGVVLDLIHIVSGSFCDVDGRRLK